MKIGKRGLFAIFGILLLWAGAFPQAVQKSAAAVTRGAYLQMAAPNAMTVRWRTDAATDSRVRFGTVQGTLTQTVDDPNLTIEHEIRLSDLTPNTKYFYSIGSTAAVLAGDV
jgi:acid phosphatase type 7